MIIPNRAILVVSGEERVPFLQGLVTNGPGDQPVYSCLLTAQGRFLYDFFIVPDGERLLIDCEADRSDDLMQALKRYRLRAKVEISDETGKYQVTCHSRASGNPGIEFSDPRQADLGHRCITNNLDPRFHGDDMIFEDWDRKRIALGIPDGSRDMVPGEALLLENNIDRLHGIDWNKGCYIGQELTARMHFKGGVKRHLMPVHIEGEAPAPGSVIFSDGAEAGQMRSRCGAIGLALLRLDMAGPFKCEGAALMPAQNNF